MENIEALFSDFLLTGILPFQLVKISALILIFSAISGLCFAFCKGDAGKGLVRIVAILVAASSITHFAVKEKNELTKAAIENAETAFLELRARTVKWVDESIASVSNRSALTGPGRMSSDLTEGALEVVQATLIGLSVESPARQAEIPIDTLDAYLNQDLIHDYDRSKLLKAKADLSAIRSSLDAVIAARVPTAASGNISGVYYLFVIAFLLGASLEIGSETRNAYRKLLKKVGVMKNDDGNVEIPDPASMENRNPEEVKPEAQT
ncbi:MAG: hypothetical protein AAGK23_09235 [Pseudomonadota bacterium]